MRLPTLAPTLAKILLAATLVALGAHNASVQAADAPVKIQALRGGTPLTQDNPPQGGHQERDRAPMDRDFVQQPPLIPHAIHGYQITKNFNKCMDCHAWQKTKNTGATKVSVTHFKSREGTELDNISPRRYFCTQCHVPQTDAKPLVENSFQRARGLQ
ncbi:nitrate reductase cytochrome c-type subunit [Aquabacterium sp. OR-4]|uniref:nitrate reductase cytochrome c-type subunit n=1 Tax=Aquabacterium sp. OR-4 TaxID=2978127 RepID=UPI0028C794B4|nr:nitrate reductase cytochrome c-type subunit [Aquabacterium sp. OR-4]MDT7838704.1 nitrate reductase cytochrome c-type subunit [Aquabacterium sp. OR-4]